MTQASKQASKQEDRFHCRSPMVGLAKARPNKATSLAEVDLQYTLAYCTVVLIVHLCA